MVIEERPATEASNPYAVLHLRAGAPRELVEEAYWLLVGKLRYGVTSEADELRRLDELNRAYEAIVRSGNGNGHSASARPRPAVRERRRWYGGRKRAEMPKLDPFETLCVTPDVVDDVALLARKVLASQPPPGMGRQEWERALDDAASKLADPAWRASVAAPERALPDETVAVEAAAEASVGEAVADASVETAVEPMIEPPEAEVSVEAPAEVEVAEHAPADDEAAEAEGSVDVTAEVEAEASGDATAEVEDQAIVDVTAEVEAEADVDAEVEAEATVDVKAEVEAASAEAIEAAVEAEANVESAREPEAEARVAEAVADEDATSNEVASSVAAETFVTEADEEAAAAVVDEPEAAESSGGLRDLVARVLTRRERRDALIEAENERVMTLRSSVAATRDGALDGDVPVAADLSPTVAEVAAADDDSAGDVPAVDVSGVEDASTLSDGGVDDVPEVDATFVGDAPAADVPAVDVVSTLSDGDVDADDVPEVDATLVDDPPAPDVSAVEDVPIFATVEDAPEHVSQSRNGHVAMPDAPAVLVFGEASNGRAPIALTPSDEHEVTLGRGRNQARVQVWRRGESYLLQQVSGRPVAVGGAPLASPIVVLEDGDEVSCDGEVMRIEVREQEATPEIAGGAR